MDSNLSNILYGQLQFIRAFDLHCCANDVVWGIRGDFARYLLGDETSNNDNIEIFLTTISPDFFVDNFLTSLRVTGLVSKILSNENDVVLCEVSTIYNMHIVKSIVTLCFNKHLDTTTSFDQLLLCKEGLFVSGVSTNNIDELNLHNGISLIERLMDMKAKNVKLTKSYLNLPENTFVRFGNARLMKNQNKLIETGFNVHGSRVLVVSQSDSFECPICMEPKKHFTMLKCKHSFCLGCLASHIELDNSNNSKCPLCRAKIILKLTP